MRKPKFRVGQVVCDSDGDYFRIDKITHSSSDMYFWYDRPGGYISGENSLRPLTARECGRRASKGSK